MNNEYSNDTRKIIFPYGEDNCVAILYPTGEIPFEDVCLKDVPENIPYIIVDQSDIPKDMTFRDAWEADFSNPDGYGLGHEKWLESKESVKND